MALRYLGAPKPMPPINLPGMTPEIPEPDDTSGTEIETDFLPAVEDLQFYQAFVYPNLHPRK